MKKKRIIKISLIGLSVAFVLGLFLLFIIMELETREYDVNEEKTKEIKAFIDNYYEYIDNCDYNNLKAWYYKNTILFSITDGNVQPSDDGWQLAVLKNTKEEFIFIRKKFLGNFRKTILRDIYEVKFLRSTYEVPVQNLFLVRCTVNYENKKTEETFLLKETKDTFKIYENNIYIFKDNYVSDLN